MGSQRFIPENWPKKGKNVIFWPQQYVVNGDRDSYAIGVSTKGVKFKIYLKLNPMYLKDKPAEAIPPSIKLLSGRNMNRRAVAEPQNCPTNRTGGVILFSKVFPDKKEPNTFIAEWADVLCSDDRSPNFLSGIGRMEIDDGNINLMPPEKAAIKKKLFGQIQSLLNQIKNCQVDSQTDALKAELEKAKLDYYLAGSLRFRAIMDQLDDIRVIKPMNQHITFTDFRSQVIATLDQYNNMDNGWYSGVVIRSVIPDKSKSAKVFIPGSSKIARKYISHKNARPNTPTGHVTSSEEAFDAHIKYCKGNRIRPFLSMNDIEIQLIPFFQVNAGPEGNSSFRNRLKTLTRTFLQFNGRSSRNAQVVVVPVQERSGNYLLQKIHAIAQPTSNILTLNDKGMPFYTPVNAMP